MRLIYTSDLHGNIALYQQLSGFVAQENADLLIIGGDLFEYGRDDTRQLGFVHEFLLGYFMNIEVPVYIIRGNTDWKRPFDALRSLNEHGTVTVLSLSPVSAGGYVHISGYEKINPSPFAIKEMERRDLADDTYRHPGPVFTFDEYGRLVQREADYLNELPSIEEELSGLQTVHPSIWVMHAPPYGTKLDVIKSGKHAGSKAVRKKIEQLQPLLTLHGHIHESPYQSGSWIDQVGETVCINPGSGKTLNAVVIDMDWQGKLKRIRHTVFGTGK